tara:strand:- start:294 stop:1364 length:1071 start_codon:yes stop_codon:yes gene_type:complete
MSILFSAFEVGSVKALIPICVELHKKNIKYKIDRKGYFKKIKINKYVNIRSSNEDIKKYLIKNSIKLLIFSVNLKDETPLKIARVAKNLNIYTMHVLDYWNGYMSRMNLDGKKPFIPDYYFVPDSLAKREAIKDGISQKTIFVSGHPDFAELTKKYLINKKINTKELSIKKDKKIILFASEPVSLDQGTSLLKNKKFRGYTEVDAMNLLIRNLESLKSINILVLVMCHPRDSFKKIKKLWSKLGGDQYGYVIKNTDPMKLLPHIDAVAGMASTLLHISWLLGKKVISIQPNLRIKNLESIGLRPGVTFIKKKISANLKIKKWISSIKKVKIDKFRNECNLHLDSNKKIILEIKKII